MLCPKCGKQNADNSNFCENCGTVLNSNHQIESLNDNLNQNSKSDRTILIFGIVALVFSFVSSTIGLILAIVGLVLGLKEKKSKNKIELGLVLSIIALIISIFMIVKTTIDIYKEINDDNNPPVVNTDNNNNNSNNDTDNNNNNNENNKNNVKGNYTRDAFSGNQFDYTTSYDNAVFTFNKDSSFEVKYTNGNTYSGTYELYNGLFITVKANEIKEDATINGSEALATDIKNVTNKMIGTGELLNVYLLWLVLDDDVIQPFAVLYNPDNNTGTIVNILARTQGTIKLK